MMSDEERRNLASEILARAIKSIVELYGPRVNEVFEDVIQETDGTLTPVYLADSEDGFGSFICHLFPLSAVETIILECEAAYERFRVEIKDVTSDLKAELKVKDHAPDELRADAVRAMAFAATRTYILEMRNALCDAVTESFLDARVVAEAVLGFMLKRYLESSAEDGDEPRRITHDARGDVENATQRVMQHKREHLKELLSYIPDLTIEARLGRKEKASIDDIRRARDRLGEQASNKSIAYELSVHESTIRKRLEREGKALDDL